MNETLISGLLGAVMGGTSSIEKSLAEEEAARRKEEEEKRREERAFTLAERKAEAEQSRKKALEEAERNRVAGMMGPETRITPGASPMEPEGVVESQIPIEERLQAGMQKAMSQGDPKAAKAFLEQYQGLEEIKRKASEEARKQEEFARGPKPERLTGEAATIDFLARQTYKGPVDEEGKPDPAAFAKHMANVSESFIGKKTYIRPEREGGAGGEKPPRAITPKEETAARNSLQRDLARLSEVTDAKGKVTRDPLMWESLNKITSRIIKEDRTKLLDPGLADEARAEVQAAIERARTDIRADLEKKTDAKGEPLPRDQIRKNEAILRNQYSFDRYSKENLPKYVNRYLGGGATEEPKRGGRPWERSWGSME